MSHPMQQQRSPPILTFSFKSLLTFPHRICNPPPSVGKVRSCRVTPFLDVRLDDVLDRKHLPPLGLKDFELYLLYVEQCPENLYFLLWFKEYAARYHIWAQRAKAALGAPPSDRDPLRIPPSPDPSLTLFYAKAKQTFLTPCSDYELDVPSDILAPFHHSSRSPPSPARARQHAHPDPAVFMELVIQVRAMLEDSLSRFVRVASTNVGSRRAICGIVGGFFCLCIAIILPLTLTSGDRRGVPHARWWRLAAFPLIWLGFVSMFTSFNGICIMVYVFGDLRQLRKFELARPVISMPMPVPAATASAGPMPLPPEPTRSSSSCAQSVRCSLSNGQSTADCSGTELSDSSSSNVSEIEVSPAYFDDSPAPEGPATVTALHRAHNHSSHSSIAFPSTLYAQERMNPAVSLAPPEVDMSSESALRSQLAASHRGEHPVRFGPSAAFIRHEVEDLSQSFPKEQGNQEPFDFDLLPKLLREHTDNVPLASDVTSPIVVASSGHIPAKHENVSLPDTKSPAIARRQYRCKRTYQPPLTPNPHDRSPDSYPSSPTLTSNHPRSVIPFMVPSYTSGVPAFMVPVTRVHSPVVVRAQWEIVTRSSFIGLVGAITLVAIFVGIVP